MSTKTTLKIEDEKTAANQLTSLLRGNYHFKGLLDTQFEPCLQALEDHILNAVSFFLKGYEI